MWMPVIDLPDSLSTYSIPLSLLSNRIPRDLKLTLYDQTNNLRSLPVKVRLPNVYDEHEEYPIDQNVTKFKPGIQKPYEKDNIYYINSRPNYSIGPDLNYILKPESPSWIDKEYIYGSYGLPKSEKYYPKPNEVTEMVLKNQNPLIVKPLTSASLDVSWNDYIPTAEIDKFRIEKWNPDLRKWEYETEVRGTKRNHVIYGLNADTPIWIRVIPYDKSGKALPPMLMDRSVKPQLKLSKPSSVLNVRVEPEESGLFAKWFKSMDDGGSPIKGYKVVLLDLTTGEETNIATIGQNENQCILPQLNPDHSWVVQIIPFNSEGCGPSVRSALIEMPNVEKEMLFQPIKIYPSQTVKPFKVMWEMPGTYEYQPQQTFVLEKWTSKTKDWKPIVHLPGNVFEYEVPDFDTSIENRFRIYSKNPYEISQPLYTDVIFPFSTKSIPRPIMPRLLNDIQNNKFDLVWRSPQFDLPIDEYYVERQIPAHSDNWEYITSVPSHTTSISLNYPNDNTKYRISSVIDHRKSEPIEAILDYKYNPYYREIKHIEPFKLEIYNESKSVPFTKPEVLKLNVPDYIPSDVDFYQIQMRQPTQTDWFPIANISPIETSYSLENFNDYLVPEASFRIKPMSKTNRDYFAKPAAIVVPHSTLPESFYRPIIARPSFNEEINLYWDVPEKKLREIPYKKIALFERESSSPEWREIGRFNLPTERVTLSERPSYHKYFYGVADVIGDKISKISSILEPVTSYSEPINYNIQHTLSLGVRHIDDDKPLQVYWDRPINFETKDNQFSIDLYVPENKYWISIGKILPEMTSFQLPKSIPYTYNTKVRLSKTTDGLQYFPISDHLEFPNDLVKKALKRKFDTPYFIKDEYMPKIYNSPNFVSDYYKSSPADINHLDTPIKNDIYYTPPLDYDIISNMSHKGLFDHTLIPPAPIGPLQIIPFEDDKLILHWQPHQYQSDRIRMPTSYIIESRPIDSNDSWTLQGELEPYKYNISVPRPNFDSYYRIRSKIGDIFSAPLTDIYRPDLCKNTCDYVSYGTPIIDTVFIPKLNAIELTCPTRTHINGDKVIDYVIQVKSNYSPFWNTLSIIPTDIQKFFYYDIEPDTIYQFQLLPRLQNNIPGISIPSNYISIPSYQLTSNIEIERRPSIIKPIPYDTKLIEKWIPKSHEWVSLKFDDINKTKLDNDYNIPIYYRIRNEDIPGKIEKYFVKPANEIKSKPLPPVIFTAHRTPLTDNIVFDFIPSVPGSLGGTPKSYIIEYKPVSDIHWKYLTESDSTNYRLIYKDLNPNVNYEFRIFSENIYGKSLPVETSLPAYYNSKIISNKISEDSIKIEPLYDSTYKIVWTPIDNSNITGYRIEDFDIDKDVHWKLLDTVSPYQFYYILDNLVPTSSYKFRITPIFNELIGIPTVYSKHFQSEYRVPVYLPAIETVEFKRPRDDSLLISWELNQDRFITNFPDNIKYLIDVKYPDEYQWKNIGSVYNRTYVEIPNIYFQEKCPSEIRVTPKIGGNYLEAFVMRWPQTKWISKEEIISLPSKYFTYSLISPRSLAIKWKPVEIKYDQIPYDYHHYLIEIKHPQSFSWKPVGTVSPYIGYFYINDLILPNDYSVRLSCRTSTNKLISSDYAYLDIVGNTPIEPIQLPKIPSELIVKPKFNGVLLNWSSKDWIPGTKYIVEKINRSLQNTLWEPVTADYIDDFQLFLPNINENDFDFRIIAVNNKSGKSLPKYVDKIIEAPISLVPVIKRRPLREIVRFDETDVIVKVGEDVIFTVYYEKDYEIVVEWLHNGITIYPGMKYQINDHSDSSNLRICNLSLFDQGLITCRIISTFGCEVFCRKLIIEAVPMFVRKTRLTTEYTISTGNNFKLELPILYSLIPQIDIYKDDNFVSDNRIKIEIIDYILIFKIDNVLLEDYGCYKIKIYNQLGCDYISFFLNVNGQPRQPKFAPIFMETDYVILIEWQYSYHDFITHYEIEYRHEYGEWIRIGTSLTNKYVTNIFSNIFTNVGCYQFRYRAVNKYGISEPSPASDHLIIETHRFFNEYYPITPDWSTKINHYDNFEKDYEIIDVISRLPDSTIYHAKERASGKIALTEIFDRKSIIENDLYIQSRNESISRSKNKYLSQSNTIAETEIPIHRLPKLLTNSTFITKEISSLYTPQKVYRSENQSAYIYPSITGESLYEPLVRRIKVSEKKIAVVIEQVLKTLKDLHSQDIVHLGIEPKNIFFTSLNDNKIKLMPSPIMQKLPSQSAKSVKLNLSYMRYISPEILAKQPLSQATDLWSLGMMIYEMFSLDDDVTKKSLYIDEYKPDLTKMEGASTELIDFTRNLLSYKPEDRLSISAALEHPWIKTISNYEEKRSSIQYDLSPDKFEMESKEFTERFMHILGVKSLLNPLTKHRPSLSYEEGTEEVLLKPYPRRPQILSHLTDVFALIGSKVILQCHYEVMNYSTYQVSWACNNIEITERLSNKYYIDSSICGYSVLEIRYIDEETSGTYSVKVINENGYAIDSCNVIVKCTKIKRKRSFPSESLPISTMAPIIVLPLFDTISMVNNNIILNTKVSGTPKPEVVWKLNGKIFDPLTTDHYSMTIDNLCLQLFIDSCTMNESGLYTLEVSNKYGFDSCSAYVQIIDKLPDPCCIPPRFAKLLPSTTIVSGTSIRLQICVTGMPLPDIQWLLNRSKIPERGFQLTFDDITGICECTVDTEIISKDIETISCIAKNIIGTAITETDLFRTDRSYVLAKRSIENSTNKYSIKHTPEFTRSLRDVQAEVGTTVSLFCSAIGTPIPEICWLKNEKKIDISNYKCNIKNYSGSAKLVIYNLNSDDFGIYTATAFNNIGRVSSSCSLVEIKNDVGERPKILRGLCNITISEGKSVELKVEVASNPFMLVKWEKDGSEINTRLQSRFSISKLSENVFSLCINNSIKSDEGLYRCTTSNKYGHAQTSGFIWVEGSTRGNLIEKSAKPSIQYRSDSIETRQLIISKDNNNEETENSIEIIESSPSTLEVVEGEEIFLWCKISANCRILAEWCKGSRTLVYDKRHRITQVNNVFQMSITKSMLTDTGKYKLTLKSEDKVVSMVCRVDVMYKSKSSRITSREQTASRESSVISTDSIRSRSSSRFL